MSSSTLKPRLIIHGGAGNISRKNLYPKAWEVYRSALLDIHRSTSALLSTGGTALDAATHAVAKFEDSPLFNCGKGAVGESVPSLKYPVEMCMQVFTRDGTIELEASVMVTRNFNKRACAVVLINKVKNPIKLAREMLIRGGKDGIDSGELSGDAGGAQGHCCLGGETVEKLAKDWGLEMVEESYFWTRRRWDEHKKGLHRSQGESILRQNTEVSQEYSCWRPQFSEQDSGWDGQAYLPQGTVGCVALDQYGQICVATSTGGLTNKLSGRIGDTPTIGAGFWAEEWNQLSHERRTRQQQDLKPGIPTTLSDFADGLRNVLGDCIPTLSGYQELPSMQKLGLEKVEIVSTIRAVAMSGTGNGDSFLRLSAARTAGAIVRFSPNRSLTSAVSQVAGTGGELQRSAGDRWGKTGEGEGGIIGIELVDGQGRIVFDFNCGGMFRCWTDDHGNEKVMVFKDEY